MILPSTASTATTVSIQSLIWVGNDKNEDLNLPSTSSSASESTTAASTSRSTLGSFVDTDGTPIEPGMELEWWSADNYPEYVLNVVHGSDGGFSICLLAVTDKSESTATTSITVLDNDLKRQDMSATSQYGSEEDRFPYGFLNCAKFLELLTKRILICVPCEATKGYCQLRMRVEMVQWRHQGRKLDVPNE